MSSFPAECLIKIFFVVITHPVMRSRLRDVLPAVALQAQQKKTEVAEV